MGIFRLKPIKRRNKIRRAVTWQTGTTTPSIDKKRIALPMGWRISKNQKEYYEARKNRSDKNPKEGL